MTTEQQGLRAGHLVALVGAIATLGSLWRPWYAVDLPQSFRDLLASEGARAASGGSMLGALVRGLAAALPSRIQATGWEALRGADVALCVVAIAGIALVVAVAGALGPAVQVDRGAASRWITMLALVGLGVAVEHVLHRPGGGALRVDVSVCDGAWIAVAGTAVMALGGALSGTGPRRPTLAARAQPFAPPTMTAEQDAERALTSVAPPGA